MILTILEGKACTGKTVIAKRFMGNPPISHSKILTIDPDFSFEYTKMLIKREHYNQIIIDEPVKKKILNYLKKQAYQIYRITCERIK